MTQLAQATASALSTLNAARALLVKGDAANISGDLHLSGFIARSRTRKWKKPRDTTNALSKRAFTERAREKAAKAGAAMADGSFPIKTTSDLRNAIRAVGRAKNPDAVKAHIRRRARALGATSMLPDSYTKAFNSNQPRDDHGRWRELGSRGAAPGLKTLVLGTSPKTDVYRSFKSAADDMDRSNSWAKLGDHKRSKFFAARAKQTAKEAHARAKKLGLDLSKAAENCTPAEAKRKKVMARAYAAMAKAGFDPGQERDFHGRWTAGISGGEHFGGGAGGSYHSGQPFGEPPRKPFPHGPGRREQEESDRHNELVREHNALRRGDPVGNAAEMRDLEARIADSRARLEAHRANRQKELDRLNNTQRPAGAQAAADASFASAERLAAQRRREQAEALQRFRQNRANEGMRLDSSDRDLLNRIDSLGSAAAAASSAASLAAVAAGGQSNATFRGALANTTGRLARSLNHVRLILGHGSQISSASDYAVIGQHLTHIQENLGSLRQELKHLPADARSLQRHTATKIKQARAATERLQRKLKAKVKALKG